MSEVIGTGYVDASYWAGMAHTVGSYLEHLEKSEDVPCPAGQLAAAKRFFSSVLEGLAVTSGPPKGHVPSANALSNALIAVRAAEFIGPTGVFWDMEMDEAVGLCLAGIRTIEDTRTLRNIPPATVSILRQLLRALATLGTRTRERNFASGNRPLP
jgi:hypothetical protein